MKSVSNPFYTPSPVLLSLTGYAWESGVRCPLGGEDEVNAVWKPGAAWLYVEDFRTQGSMLGHKMEVMAGYLFLMALIQAKKAH